MGIQTHGEGSVRRGRSKEYRAWQQMRVRCGWKAGLRWERYGGRGVRVCERWAASFEAFLADVGRAPSSEHSLDRIDLDGHYEPGNVRWATREQQMRNTSMSRRLTFRGETLTVVEWAERVGIPAYQIRNRLDVLGWSVEVALTTPLRDPSARTHLIIEFLRVRPRSPGELASLLGTSKGSVANTLTRHCKSGLVIRLGSGLYGPGPSSEVEP